MCGGGEPIVSRVAREELHGAVRRLRERVVAMASRDKSIHVGASLSIVDLVAVLFLRRGLRRSGPRPTERDWFILSKGHAAPVLYAVLAETGILGEELLEKIRCIDGLEGHPDISLPGVDVSTGSLGQGLSIAAGIALAMRLDGSPHKVFVVLGDGELDEGQVWEAAATIAHLGLSNVVAIVDVNGYQLDGPTSHIKAKGDIAARFASLGWRVVEIDGHSHEMIEAALSEAEASERPTVIIAYTRRGKGLGVLEARGAQHLADVRRKM